MYSRLKLTLEILKNAGRIRSNKLVKRLMEKGPMARQTAINTINEGVNSRKIFREDAMIGKQEAVYYTVYPDIAKDEKFLLDQTEKFLKDFDDRFLIFEDKFSSLSIGEKAVGVEGFYLFLINYSLTVRTLWEAYEKKREWKTLLNEVNSRKASFDKLLKSRPKKEQSIISKHVLEGKLLYLDEAKGSLDEFLHKIK